MDLAAFESVELSDRGRRRQNNEDACLRLPELGIYCVADGMGGVMGGDLASEAVTNTLQASASRVQPHAQARLADRVTMVKTSINQASRWIRDFAARKIIGQMGTTVVVLIFDPRNPSRAIALHAGDSRLYRFQNGRLEQLTSDHTSAAVFAAQFGRSQASLPVGMQNELTRAVGLNDTVDLEQTFVKVQSGDLFLLCSDGLTRMVSDATLIDLLTRGSEKSMSALAESLITRANDSGGKDNITVVLVRVGDISAAAAAGHDDDDLATAVAPDATSQAPPLLPSFSSGPPEPGDTPATFEGETPTTDDPTPNRA
jgi:protein phosphatase